MNGTITVNPMTWISGFMEIEVKVENSKMLGDRFQRVEMIICP